MQSCFCPSCKDTREFHISERLGVKAAAAVMGGVTKAAGFVVDQVQYEEDKKNNWRPIADGKLAHNKMKTEQYSNISARWTKELAGGAHEARCNTCKNVISFPAAQNFEEFKVYSHLAHAHQNRWPMAILGFFLGAAIATLFGKFGANATYSMLCMGFGAAGYFSPRFLNPIWNSYINVFCGSMKLIWGLSAGFMIVSVVGANMGEVGLIICLLAYAGGAGWYLYNRVKGDIAARKELFESHTTTTVHKDAA